MEMKEGSVIHQVLIKLLNGNHKALNFTTQSISTQTLKHKIQTLTSIPSHLQLLLPSNSFYPLHDNQTLNLSNGSGNFPVVVHLLLRLRGGKGGFGSLLRGAATKAGQKKTNNFDACRDMSGRRLRHVNAEKKLEEWRAEAEERKLEKMAEEFLKKNAKEAAKKGKGVKGDNTDKYVQKYREDSAKCMEEVERSVRESLKGFVSSKRKGVELNESDSKKLKIWKGKRIMGESDSDSEDLDDDDSDEEEEENDKSIVIDNGDNSDSNGEAEGSLDSVTGRKVDGGASESGSEEEKDTLLKNLESAKDVNVNAVQQEGESLSSLTPDSQEIIGQSGVASTFATDIASATESIQTEKEASGTEPIVVESSSGVKESNVAEPSDNLSPTPVPQEDAVSEDSDLEKPFNFEEFSSASELEVLGMERLKSELQARGLKCGGTLQERAARLFLLKTTPLEMLPKKLLAKK
ncbi:uncharacterized protein LOC132063780 [Lycium ferocissimum]|uniref:uncharacterized protein LOC132063780 n=1 Tax=Lycium ferocissimum TaxID=112874 RepID=UPI0028169556|nr:uncharacterized protein LOC132063780 [Lycium ferocissimum]